MSKFIFRDFIKNNVAPNGATNIGVFDNKGNIVGTVSLDSIMNQGETPVYKFGLLSDIHVDTTDYNYSQYINSYPYSDEGEGDFRRALNWINAKENVDMYCACGDLSQNGTTAEFAMPQGVIGECLPPSKNIPFYTCTGNHDVKTAGGNGFGTYFLRDIEKTWNGMTNFERSSSFNESFCFDKACGEHTDHFIFFSMYSYSLGSSASPYNNSDITWLQNKLETWKNDRVFVFTHLFFPDYAGNLGRVNGSGGIYPSGNWLGGTQLTTLSGFLSRYKNAIWFSGHSHWKWDLQKHQQNLNIQQYGEDGAWTVHVPSLALPIDSNYTDLGSETESNRVEKPLESQGGVVYVYEDRIEIRGIDFNVNASQYGSTERGYTGTEYTRYLPIAHYNMSTTLKTIYDPVNPNDPVQGYYIVTSSGKDSNETITKEGEYVVLTYSALSQCVGVTNGLLTASDVTNGATVTADDIKVIYNDQEIALGDIANYGIYMEAASDTGGGSYANLSDLLTANGISGASVQEFAWMDSNRQNAATQQYGIQFNVSSRFITGNAWADALDSSHKLVVKIKNLKINGVAVNTQEGSIGGNTGEGGNTGLTYEMVNVSYSDINSMNVDETREVIMVNPHKTNGYVLGYNGTSAVSSGNGFATEQDMKNAAGPLVSNDNYHMLLTKKQDTRIDNIETQVPRTFNVANGGSVTLTQPTSSISGWKLYRAQETRNGTRQINITYDGNLPVDIYLKAYKGTNNASMTTTITGGSPTSVTSSTNNTLTSLSNFTKISMTAATMNISTTIGSTNTTYYVYVLVPSNPTDTVTTQQEVPSGDPYYTLTSKVGNMSPTGTTADAGWSSTPMHYTIENATSLSTSTDLTSGISASGNPNLVRIKNPSNNYLNAGGALSSLKFADGTGEWSVWYMYDATNVGDYLQKANFETNTDKKSPDVNTYVKNLSGGYVAVSFDANGQGFWVTPTNFTNGTQPTLIVDDIKVYSGMMTTSGTTISLPQYVGFYEGSNHSGADRYQIANGFQPSISETGSNGRMQFQTSSSFSGGTITIVMKARFDYGTRQSDEPVEDENPFHDPIDGDSEETIN